jgi:16S rRNA (adenine1518-N6/adenine1519-N6)-dimethyltransferase
VSAHVPRKRFGQHFLHERRYVERIVAAFHPSADEHVVEIGPGLGVLTRELLHHVPALDAVELDRDLAARLPAELAGAGHVTVHQADALTFDFCRLAQPGIPLRVIGNLPYNISTPLLFHLLDQSICIQDMLFMLQKEVVDRMSAAAGAHDYGRLSVMLQWRCQVERLFDVPPGAFTPPPKVDSSVVRVTPYTHPPVDVGDVAHFAVIVKAAFAQRRKTLRNNLKDLVSADTMAALGIDPGRRAETLTLQEFAALAQAPGKEKSGKEQPALE